MGDISVTVGGDTINVTTNGKCQNVTLGNQVTIKDQFERKSFIGDGTNQTITLDGNTARDGSILVFFSGSPGELNVDYTVAVDNTSITFLNSFKTGRKGEVRYVKN